jgi:transposase
METRYTDEFRRDAVRIAVTIGLTRPQVSSDLGVGLSTEQVGSKAPFARQGIAQQCPEREHDDLMAGPHEDVEKENERLRKEIRLLREEREMLKKAAIRWPTGEWNIHR